jgi:methyl-accepting chemotaxis protein
MTIKKKLFLCYGLMMVLTLATALTGIAIFTSLSSTLQELANGNLARVFFAANMQAMSEKLLSQERATWILSDAQKADLAAQSESIYEATAASITENSQQLRQLSTSEEAIRLLDEFDADLSKAASTHQAITRAEAQSDMAGSQQLLMMEYRPLLVEAQAIPLKLRNIEKANAKQSAEDAASQVARGHWLMILAILFCAAAGVLLAWVIRQLDAQLRQSIRELSEGSDQVASAASQVSSSSQSLAQDTSEQAAMIEETSASSEEISSMARRNTEHAQSATRLLGDLSEGMDQANRALADSVLAMDAMSESSDKISAIIGVIEKIAFQTNILALNAAVEAARAGDAGMGFAVVAEEVRNLAQRCAQAAKDTSDLIGKSVETVGSGKLKVLQVSEAGQRVSEMFLQIKHLVDEIQVSSQEQGGGVEQISKAISQMEQRTQKSAANAEESAAAAEELTAQSQALQEIADQLNRMVGADEGRTVSRRKSFAAPPRSRELHRSASYATKKSRSAPVKISAYSSPKSIAASAMKTDDAAFEDSFTSF